MTVNVSGFLIKELSLVYKEKRLDISGLFQELNIYDSILLPCMHGNIVMIDAKGLTDELTLDGSENLIVNIQKNEFGNANDALTFKKVFRIFKQTNRKNVNLTAEAYILHFISEEYILSEQLRVTQSYENTYGNIASSILEDYLGVNLKREIEKGGLFSNTIGMRKIVIPNLHPIDAIEWCAKRSLDENESPTFLFFENMNGYNFVNLAKLLLNSPIAKLNFIPKNISLGDKAEEVAFLGVKDFKVLTQYDFLKNVQNGVYAGKFIGFDPITRTIAQREISFDDHYYTMKHSNKVPNLSVVKNKLGKENIEMFDAKQSVYVFGYYRNENEYINENDPESLNFVDDPYKYIFQRKAIIQNFLTQRVQVLLPGNFSITSGVNVELLVPKLGERLKDDDNYDKSLYGKYLVIAAHHSIKPTMHEVVIECASDSSNRELGVFRTATVDDARYYA